VVLMHLSFIIITVAFSLQVLQKHTESCRARAENSNFCSDIGAETFDDTYTNESLTMVLTGQQMNKEQSCHLWYQFRSCRVLIITFYFESENVTLHSNDVCL